MNNKETAAILTARMSAYPWISLKGAFDQGLVGTLGGMALLEEPSSWPERVVAVKLKQTGDVQQQLSDFEVAKVRPSNIALALWCTDTEPRTPHVNGPLIGVGRPPDARSLHRRYVQTAEVSRLCGLPYAQPRTNDLRLLGSNLQIA